ncbi:MAG TPA: amidohydrolase family protein [Acidimicrobiales bacterium]|nr:amidohydrolase family protein [Acidimicrobiales bacterium]
MEDVLDPDLPICDPHHHLWDHPGSRYMVEELRADTGSGHRIESTVFVECGSGYRDAGPESMRPVGETVFLVEADPTGFVAGIVGMADLRVPDIDDVLAAHVDAGAGRFRGIRHASAWDASPDIRESHTKPPPRLLAESDFRRGFAALGRAGLRFDAWLYHPQLPELAALARAHPDVPIVLDHLGGPLGIGPYAGRRDEVRASWRASMAEVAACENVTLKLGGIGMPIYGMGWHKAGGATSEQLAEAWGEPIRWCIETFGARRCMFESNFPVDRASCSYRVLWNAFKRIVADASPSERADLFQDTARRAYGLGGGATAES